jgi:hypothetical protein
MYADRAVLDSFQKGAYCATALVNSYLICNELFPKHCFISMVIMVMVPLAFIIIKPIIPHLVMYLISMVMRLVFLVMKHLNHLTMFY